MPCKDIYIFDVVTCLDQQFFVVWGYELFSESKLEEEILIH